MKQKLMIIGVIVFALIFNGLFVACTSWEITDTQNPYTRLVMEEIADTAGYALGAFARKNEDLAAKAKELYEKYAEGGITAVDVMNEGLSYLVDTNDPIQLALAHKIKRLIVRMGGQVSGDWQIINLGLIDEELLAIGRDAYLAALTGQV